MRLIKIEVTNFKLLQEVRLHLSTDPRKPLTAIRAENGSGKTSLLYAIQWCFYGMDGLPDFVRQNNSRLTSTFCEPGTPVTVEVTIEFEVIEDDGQVTSYRLRRVVQETPGDGTVKRGHENVLLVRLTAQGDQPVAPADAYVAKFLPSRLADVFFTNGDDVQHFISGRLNPHDRQEKVHRAIRALLGHDQLFTAVADLDSTFQSLKRKASKAAGASAEALQNSCDGLRKKIVNEEGRLEKLEERLQNMEQQRARWERELLSIKGIGDIDQLNAEIIRLEGEIDGLEKERSRVLSEMRNSIKSQELSWALLGERLQKGLEILDDLADRRLIPNTSMQILQDRLDLEECICGADLSRGSDSRSIVESLLADQRQETQVAELADRLTAIRYAANTLSHEHDSARDDGRDFANTRRDMRSRYANLMDELRRKNDELKQVRDRRRRIDSSQIAQLSRDIDSVGVKISETNREIGKLEQVLNGLRADLADEEAKLAKVSKQAQISEDLAIKRDVAEDLLSLARRVQARLEGDYVQRVAKRMQALFLEITGAGSDTDARSFSGVSISENFDIIVESQNEATLDTDFELFGASQRALTLAFIWALMEVSGVVAPRVIDTPLGMISGGVRRRMVDLITRPPAQADPSFQVILLLTRAEIAGVEDLISSRAGVINTLSCSQQYPIDLAYGWGGEFPTSRICSCTHFQTCRVCARTDDKPDLDFRDEEATL